MVYLMLGKDLKIHKMKIALNLIATNKYISFVPEILKSADNYFFPDDELHVVVHTDMEIPELNLSRKNTSILRNKIDHEPWPSTTLKRFHYFTEAKNLLKDSDYIFYIDVDSLFIGKIDQSSISKKGIFATIHPGLNQGSGTPERNPDSEAYIPFGSTSRYFCGGFFGGDSSEFLSMSLKIKEMVEKDLSKGIIAIWHDESHLNKYLSINSPSVIFEFPFAVAENLTPIFNSSRIKFLDKSSIGGHDFFRT